MRRRSSAPASRAGCSGTAAAPAPTRLPGCFRSRAAPSTSRRCSSPARPTGASTRSRAISSVCSRRPAPTCAAVTSSRALATGCSRSSRSASTGCCSTFCGHRVQIRDGFTGAIGNTPLIRLRGPSERTGCNVLVKGTAGNTGIGLALVGNARGYRTVIVMPNTQSQEKKDMLRLCGAELREVPAVPYKDPNNYVHVSERVAKEIGAFWANQWDNTANRDGHYRSTGPEIWEQTDGRIDGFTCAIGTGGTLAGISRFLKEKNPRVRTVAADPMGAAMYSWFKRRELTSEGSSVTEGIGLGRVTRNIEGAPVDDAYQIPDGEAIPLLFELMKHEGLCLGGSSAINVAGAIRLARELGPGSTVVTILADSGTRYQSKLFNPRFLKEKGLPFPDWL